MNREEFFNNLDTGATWSAGVAFKRSNPLPLDKYSVFKTLTDAENYAKDNPVAYPGQVIAVVDEKLTTVYVIQESKTLQKLAQTSVSGDVSTEIAELKDAIKTLNSDAEGSVNKKVQTAINNLVAGAPGTFDTLKEISDWIESHKDGTTNILEDIAALKAKDEVLEPRITVNGQNIVDITNKIGGLGGLTVKKDTLVEAINEIHSNAAQKSEVSNLSTKVTEVETLANTGVQDAKKAQNKANANELKINELINKDVAQDSSIQTLETAQSNLVKTVNDINTTVTSHGSAIDNINSKVSSLETSLKKDGEIFNKIEGNTSKITELEKTVQGNSTTISSNSQSITTLESAIKNVYTKDEIGTLPIEEKNLVDYIKSKDNELQEKINGKVSPGTTLKHYGITDAYTIEQAQAEIASQVAASGHLKRLIVDRESYSTDIEALNALIEGGKDEHTIYMLKDSSVLLPAENDSYKEYMYIGAEYVLIGNSKVDLTNYLKKGEADLNKIESISTDDKKSLPIGDNKNIHIPTATAAALGLVKGNSTDANHIRLKKDGQMYFDSINVDTITWNGTLCIDGGNASLKKA